MCTTSVRIEPLNAENYDTWKLQMRAILIKNDLWAYVDGTNPCPIEESAKTSWLTKDCKASADITLSISPGELGLISECATAKETWDKLKNTYQSKGPAKKATLLKRVALARLKEGENIREHLNSFFDAVKKLKEIGVLIGEELLAILLLYSLPHSFETFRCALETRDDLPKLDALRVKILEESESRKATEERVEQDAFYANRSNPNHKFNKNNPGKRLTCYKCGKNGHFANKCFSKQTNNKSQNARNSTKSHNIHNNSETILCSTESAFFGSDLSNKWCLDSGCTSHMSSNAENFQTLSVKNSFLYLANDKKANINGVGSVKLDNYGVTLSEVLHVSGLRTNLLSISKITDKGFKVHFEKNSAVVLDGNNNLILTAVRTGNLYFLSERESVSFANNIENTNINSWHQKMGHLNEKDLQLLKNNNLVYGLNIKSNDKFLPCEICVSQKQVREKFIKTNKNRTAEVLEIVHSDVCGPFRVKSMSGGRYFATFIDDYSRWCVVYILKHKSELFNVFKKYKAEVELKTGKKIKTFQTDNGTEYCNREFNEFFENCGITRRLSSPYTPQQNGVAERKNRTLLEMARCLLKQAGAPASFWGEAINTACYIRNHCPTKALDNNIPYKLWTGKTPTVQHFKIFGTKAYVLNKGNKSKLESRSNSCIFVGYSLQSKAYRLWCPEKRSIIISRDVKFLPQSGFENQYSDDLEVDQTVECVLNDDTENSYEKHTDENDVASLSKRGRGRPKKFKTGQQGRPKKIYQTITTENNIESEEKNADIQGTNESSSAETEIDDYESANFIAENGPTTLNDALDSDDAEAWQKALNKEFLAQLKNQTWEVVARPNARKAIGYRYVFTTKDDGTKKARLVAKGCSQRRGEDFHATFSPVVRFTSIRILSALASELNLEIHQMDVVAAYLNGDLDETIFMETPDYLRNFLEYFLLNFNNNAEYKNLVEYATKWLNTLNDIEDNVCLLKKALYGLRQSGLSWYRKLQDKLLNAGLKPTEKDPCLFIKHENNKILIVTIYVDDLLIASNSPEWIVWLKTKLSSSFEMKDMGNVKTCLGIQFIQNLNENYVFMSQQKYISAILDRFGMSDCKKAQTPIEVNCKLTRTHEKDDNVMRKIPYQRLIGSLMYLSVCTRPDISYAVNFLSQFNSNYNEEHWKAAKRVLRYLRGTANYGLFFKRTGESLFGTVDADWAADLNDRKSFTGYSFILGGASISWEARKQRTVALSSTEAEYMALSSATREAVYLKSLLNELRITCSNLNIFNDNQSALKIAEAVGYSSRTKHIDVRHHFVRECVEEGIIQLIYMPTEEMPADVLSKGLNTNNKHNKCITSLGVRDLHF